jgi:type IV secretion system protein VirB6
MAYIGLSVMISLAPFFIILMLFEQTKSIFDNWLSTLFNYMIQPTILLIFFLLIDQIMSEQLLKVVVRACWGTLIPIEIGLDLTHMDIPVNFSFPIPFLPGIPFFVPNPTPALDLDILMHGTGTFLTLFSSALILYCYSLMAYGLVDYIAIVVAQLTNVTPARREGNFQEPSNPTSAIMEDIKGISWGPASDAAGGVAKFIKKKTIDQDFKATTQEPSKEKKEGYTGKIFASRNDADLGGGKNE